MAVFGAIAESQSSVGSVAMAFEDAFWLMVLVPTAAMPLLLLLPRARVARAQGDAEEH